MANNHNHKKQDGYQMAGVDIDKGNQLAQHIANLTKLRPPHVLSTIGGFSAILDIKKIPFEDPLLLLSCDGVGTKLDIAIKSNNFSGIGADLVAMAVNDILVMGGIPIAFLDYYAVGKLDEKIANAILASIKQACDEADCPLVGGETAEMPDFYQGGKLDLAGFVVGAVERKTYENRPQVAAGDLLIGLPSSGFHSNGFSLIRKVITDHNIALDSPPPYDSPCPDLASDLLTPTRIYKKTMDHIHDDITAAAHITGGGLRENLPRVWGENLTADFYDWEVPEKFRWLQKIGKIDDGTMYRSFNMGVGMVLMVAPDKKNMVLEKLQKKGEEPILLGRVIER